MSGNRTGNAHCAGCGAEKPPIYHRGKRLKGSGSLCAACAIKANDQAQADERESIRALREKTVRSALEELDYQPDLVAVLLGIVYNGTWPDGVPVEDEKVRMKAAAILHSKIPTTATSTMFKERKDEGPKELKIDLRLDGLPDPSVTRERIERVHAKMLDPPKDNGDDAG